jgi:hypothetical protein
MPRYHNRHGLAWARTGSNVVRCSHCCLSYDTALLTETLAAGYDSPGQKDVVRRQNPYPTGDQRWSSSPQPVTLLACINCLVSLINFAVYKISLNSLELCVEDRLCWSRFTDLCSVIRVQLKQFLQTRVDRSFPIMFPLPCSSHLKFPYKTLERTLRCTG